MNRYCVAVTPINIIIHSYFSARTAIWSAPVVLTVWDNDQDSQNHENHKNPHEFSQTCWKQEELISQIYIKVMRIHEDSPMIYIESLSCVHKISKINKQLWHHFDITIVRLELRSLGDRCLQTALFCLIFLCNFRWVRPDIAPRSGAAIIEIDIPTGFYIRKQTLRKTMRRETRIPARRFRFTRQTVVLYLDYVSILSFRLLQWQFRRHLWSLSRTNSKAAARRMRKP